MSLGSLFFPTLLFLVLPNWTSARRGHAPTFRLSRHQQWPQLQQNRRVTPLRTPKDDPERLRSDRSDCNSYPPEQSLHLVRVEVQVISVFRGRSWLRERREVHACPLRALVQFDRARNGERKGKRRLPREIHTEECS
ncbi:hypothetical protein MTP99_015816 [Tenebrio molitor]|jgi:hypothetical protein|nr:hypothetical protein MTP99_015816 [Tenebrio molitor]